MASKRISRTVKVTLANAVYMVGDEIVKHRVELTFAGTEEQVKKQFLAEAQFEGDFVRLEKTGVSVRNYTMDLDEFMNNAEYEEVEE